MNNANGKIVIKSKSKREVILAIVGIAFFLFACVLWVYYGIYFPKQYEFKSYEFLVKKGDGFRQVAFRLESQGIIKSKIFFEVYGVLTDQYKSIQPGRYELSPSFDIADIFWKIARGEYIKKRILIMEGFSIKDIEKALKNRKVDAAIDFATSCKTMDFSQQFEFLKDKPKEASLEGYLFPDTYDVRVDATPNEFIIKMLGNFGRKLTQDLRDEIQKQGKTIYEILTMASLLEHEAYNYNDRQIIAGILWKRIAKGWLLQVDAALTFVTGRYSMELTLKDLAMDSPYNVYKYKGLPYGPICNPGIESIKAAIYPKETAYWYYLSTRAGQIIFSKTGAEHVANKANR